MPASGLQLTHHGQLLPEPIFIQLMSEIVRYLDSIFQPRQHGSSDTKTPYFGI
jgi:hypothetical protein